MKKKLIIILSVVVVITILMISSLVYAYSNGQFDINEFKVNEFKEEIEIAYNTTFQFDEGNICYGNKYRCHEVSVSHEGEVDPKVVGEYKIKYIYQYKDKELEKEQIVKVEDKDSPTINVEDNNFTVCPNQTTANFKVEAFDEHDGDLSKNVTQVIEGNQVIFQVADSSGNKIEVTKDLTFQDSQKPTLTLKGNKTIYVKLNGKYTEPGATATDNCDGNINKSIKISGKVDTSKTGEYQISYQVSDKSGNKQSLTRKVIVYKENNSSVQTATDKTIYLTFDDGPGPYTNKLLDVLKKYNVKATFFVTDQSITKGYDDVILRAYNEGHTIGLHTSTHNYNIYRSEEAYFKDLYAIQEKVKRITGHTSMIIRFPGGSSNTVSRSYDNGKKIMSTLTAAVEAKGFKYFDWNVSSGDAGSTTSTQKVVSNVTKSLGSKKTYVVLQHDTKSFSVNAVEEIIKYGLAKGYKFEALTMDSPVVHHKVNN